MPAWETMPKEWRQGSGETLHFVPDASRRPAASSARDWRKPRRAAGSSVGNVLAVFSHSGHDRVDGRLGVQACSREGGPDNGAKCGEAGFVLPDVDDGEAAVRLVADVVESVWLRVDGGAAEFEDLVVFGGVFTGEVEDDDDGHGA